MAQEESKSQRSSNSHTVLIIVIVVVVLSFLCLLGCAAVVLVVHPWNVTPTPTIYVTPTLTETPATDMTGGWRGTYTITSPAFCAGYEGDWDAALVDTNGIITGSYTSDAGLTGNVDGRINGSSVNWDVSGGGGVSFTGSINGDNISGNFTGPSCTGNSGHTSGTFTGGRARN